MSILVISNVLEAVTAVTAIICIVKSIQIEKECIKQTLKESAKTK